MSRLLLKPAGTAGKVHDVTPETAGWGYVGFALWRLGPGETASDATLDTETILREAGKSGRMVVVAENHSVIGGLGEAVASTLLRHRVHPSAFELAGLPDAFLDAGALPTLHDRYGISVEALGRRIKGWLA